MANQATIITEHLDTWSSAIKAKSSAGRGNRKAQESYGIRKLRELILELGVSGLLVPRDPNDEPALSVLTDSKKSKELLATKRKLRTDKAIYSSSDLFEIPETWEWACIGSFCHVLGGKRVPRGYSLLGSPTDHAYIRVTDMKKGTVSEHDLKYIDNDIFEKISKYIINKEDVYVTIAGTIGAAGSIPELLDGMNLTENAAKLVFRDVNKDFLVKALGSVYVQDQFGAAVNQMAQPKLSLASIKKTVVALPPLAEQRRIVAKVDELMALCDQLEQQKDDNERVHGALVKTLLDDLTVECERGQFAQAWQRIISHFDTLFTTESSIDQLKQTILQLAVMGKLVEQNPLDVPATELIEEVATEKEKLLKAKQVRKQKALPAVTKKEVPFELPCTWRWCRIGDISICTDYGLSDKSFATDTGVPVLAMGHIQSGKVLLGRQKRVPTSVESLPQLYLQDRDLLYNRTNSAELVGKTGIYRGADNEYTFASYLIRIRTLKDSALPEMLNLNMLTRRFRETQIIPHLKQQCGQANVNGTVLKSMLVAIPPKQEMSRIVAKVDELMVVCDRLKATIQSAQTTQLHLADTLVEAAIH